MGALRRSSSCKGVERRMPRSVWQKGKTMGKGRKKYISKNRMKTHLYTRYYECLLEILLQRLVTFLVDGQRESVSVLLIRYGMSEHYTIGYYDIALADKLINTASYRMRFFH